MQSVCLGPSAARSVTEYKKDAAMMRALMTKTLFVFCIATVIVGCKISVIVPSGGDVQSNSGTRNCPGAQV